MPVAHILPCSIIKQTTHHIYFVFELSIKGKVVWWLSSWHLVYLKPLPCRSQKTWHLLIHIPNVWYSTQSGKHIVVKIQFIYLYYICVWHISWDYIYTLPQFYKICILLADEYLPVEFFLVCMHAKLEHCLNKKCWLAKYVVFYKYELYTQHWVHRDFSNSV